MLGPLLFVQRAFHKELQFILLLLTGRADVSLVIFSLLLLPGVVLHELSHFLMAVLLRIRTGRLSLIPQRLGNGHLQMGYVETEKVDFLRDSIVGFAPLLSGGFVVVYIGKVKLGFLELWKVLITQDFPDILESLEANLARPDFWFWFYLMVVVSGTMLPSPSDRRSWAPVLVGAVVLIGIGIFFDVGPWFAEKFGTKVNELFRSLTIVFVMSTVVHLVVFIPTMLIRKGLTKITGLQATIAR